MEILEEEEASVSSGSSDEEGAGEGEGGKEEDDEADEDHITFAEIESFLNKMPAAMFPDGEKPSAENVKEIMLAADTNQDGEINIEEFVELMENYGNE